MLWAVYGTAVEELFDQHLSTRDALAMERALHKALDHLTTDRTNVETIAERVAQ